MKRENKKKVLFVEPRGAHSNVFEAAMKIPLLGPVYLATIAKQAGYDVSILNENILGRKIKENELEIDVLCLSCLTATVKRGMEIAKLYKSINPKGRAIIGGIHASTAPNDVLPYFDQVIVGEAENIILDILSGKIKDKIVYASKIALDDVPIPDFKLIKDWQKIKYWPVMTSRGCPYACNFCAVTEMFGRKYRTQSPERVMEDIIRYKKGKIFFSDDHFAADIQRTNKLLDLMINSGFNRKWGAQVRTNVTKYPEFVAKMRKANCQTVYIGFESINPKSLVDMKKNQTVEDIRRSIRVFHDNGIRVHGMFMFGTDYDKKNIFNTTSDFCHDNSIDTVQYAILTPLPGTHTYYSLEKQKRLLHKNWDMYDGFHAVFKPKHMTALELQQGMIDCFSDFYSYANAFNDALNALGNTAIASFKRMYKRVNFPSFKTPIIKIKGRTIVKNWIEHNDFYINYLKNLPMMDKRVFSKSFF